MKKFLTVLLVIAVMFTFSFGSAFAADPVKYYTADDAAAAMETVMNNNMTYVNAAKVKLLAAFTYDSTTNYVKTYTEAGVAHDVSSWFKYQEGAVVAGVDKLVDKAEDAMKDAIRTKLDAFPTTTGETSLAAYTQAVVDAVAPYDTAEELWVALMDVRSTTMDKAQAPLTKAFIEAKIAKYYNAENYPATGAYKATATDKALTAKEVVEYVVAEAAKNIALAEADTTKTNAQKIAAYEQAYSDMETLFGTFKNASGNGVTTITSKEETDAAEVIAVDNAMAAMKTYAIGTYYKANVDARPVPAAGSSAVTNFKSWAEYWTIPGVDNADQPMYVAKTASKNATVFGVEVKDITQVTRAEHVAINAAFYQAIMKTLDVAEVYAGVEGSAAVPALHASMGAFDATLKNAIMLAATYDEVVELGDDLKGMYVAGSKIYDDAKVDAAVKAAEEFVYGDLAGAFKDAEEYVVEAVADIEDDATIDTYEKALAELKLEENCPFELFEEAKADAADKFIPAIITYGANKTADADKIYCKNYYAVSAANYWGTTYGAKYETIKADALADLAVAQSYAEIDAIMAEAAAELAKLLPAEGSAKVLAARDTYVTALAAYETQVKGILGSDYTQDALDAAEVAGTKLIKNALTVDAVKAAFAEAQAKMESIVDEDAIEDAEDAAEDLIDAIPAYSKLTVADKAAVEAARAAVDALPYGAVVTTTRLENAEEKIFALEADALEEEVKVVEKAIAALGTSLLNDRDAAAAVAMKAEVQALAAKVKAHNDAVEDYEDNYVALSADCDVAKTAIDAFLAPVDANNAVYGAELYLTRTAINALEVSGKTVDAEAVKAAQAKFENLNDRQQYILVCQGVAETLKLAQEALVDDVEALKITASSVVKKGSITVKWSVDGNEEAADAYEIWRSTKKNSGFKKMFTTEKMSYKNTKNLKKGTRYYFKVRAIATIDGEKVKSDWSNKAYRVAK